MAFVTSLEKDTDREVRGLHPTRLVCRYFSSENMQKPIFQINSYGSEDRENPEKLSQTLQFDEQSGRELFNALQDVFGFKMGG